MARERATSDRLDEQLGDLDQTKIGAPIVAGKVVVSSGGRRIVPNASPGHDASNAGTGSDTTVSSSTSSTGTSSSGSTSSGGSTRLRGFHQLGRVGLGWLWIRLGRLRRRRLRGRRVGLGRVRIRLGRFGWFWRRRAGRRRRVAKR